MAGSVVIGCATERGANKRALPRRGNAEKRRKLGHLTRRASLIPTRSSPTPWRDATRHDAALWNFCGTAFFNWCNSNQPPVPPGALVKLFVAFRARCARIRSSAATFPSIADPSPSSRKNTRWGHSWDTSTFLETVPPYGIMPVLRWVTLSALVISLAGNITWKRNGDIADVSRLL